MSSFTFKATGAAFVHIEADISSLVKGLKEGAFNFQDFASKIAESAQNARNDAAKSLFDIGNSVKRLNDETKKSKESAVKTKQSFGSAIFNEISGDTIKNAVSGVWSTFKRVADVGDEFIRLSKKTDLSIESISTLSYVSQRSDVSLEALTSSAVALGNSINSSSEDVAAALTECGLSLDSLKDKTELDQFKEVAGALSKIEDPARRAALATTLLGDSSKELEAILNGETESLDVLLDEASTTRLVMSEDAAQAAKELHDAMERLHLTFQGFTQTLAQLLIPFFEGSANVLRKFISRTKELKEEHEKTAAVVKAGVGPFMLFITAAVGLGKAQEKLSAAWKTATTLLGSLRTASAASAASAGAEAGARTAAAVATTAQTAATKGLTVSLAGLRVAALAAGGVLTIGIVAASAFMNAKTAAAELSDEMAKAVESGNKARQAFSDKFDFLASIANQEGIADDAFEKGAKYIEELRQKYGDLGIEADKTTKSITMTADAQARFNDAIRAESAAELERQIAEEQENFRKLQDEQQRKLDAYSSWQANIASLPRNALAAVAGGFVESTADKWAEEMDETGKKLLDTQKNLNELRKKLKAINEGDVDAAKGEEDAVATPVDENAGDKIENLDKEIQAAEEKTRRARQNAAQNAIDDVKAEEAAYVDALKARLALENAKPESARDAGLINSLNEKIAGSDARVAEDLAKRVAEMEEKTTSATASATEQKIAAIEKETQAYRELLEAAAAAAGSEEEAAKYRDKLAQLDASTSARKNEVYAEQDKAAGSTELADARRAVAEAVAAASRDGTISQDERRRIDEKQTALQEQERKESARKLEETSRELSDAALALKQAREDGDQAAISEAAERYSSAAEAFNSANSTLAMLTEETTGESQTEMIADEISGAFGATSKEFSSAVTLSSFEASQIAALGQTKSDRYYSRSLSLAGSNLAFSNQIDKTTASIEQTGANSLDESKRQTRLLEKIAGAGNKAAFA